ncbi:MAG: mannose-1-phosphate guanylyltransferase [Bacteroidales bacterium]|nr:mannose-1-phosphate guanylyltransferase [Bacteroidales bacterium]
MENRFCIIMAGGIGSRFWPLSKQDRPKQFLDILGTGRSFIRSTFDRFSRLVPAENFLVVTNAAYRDLVLEELPMLTADQVLCEPMRRNTAPCIAYASYRIRSRCPEALIAVTPADHLVTDEASFERTIATGFDFLKSQTKALLTIGIRPSRPETGYGYIEVAHGSQPAVCAGNQVVRVEAFKEKPDLPTARSFVEAGNFYWNSGIFLWSLEGIMAAYNAYLPDMVALFDEGANLFGTEREQAFIDGMFARCENISIDYGVMERASERYTIPADFGWSDIGTWGSLFEHSQRDAGNNALRGRVEAVECHNSVVNIEDGVTAVVQGLEGCLVAYRDGSLLVCKLDREQEIKNWVERL